MAAKNKRTGNRRPRISVRKTTTVRTSKNGRQVAEKYTPTGKGPARSGVTSTRRTAGARAASQSGKSHASDRRKVARAPGKRAQTGKKGKITTYYEYRANRSDADKRRRR